MSDFSLWVNSYKLRNAFFKKESEMKLIIVVFFLVSLNCFAEDYICLVDPNTKEVTNITIDTSGNRDILEKIKGDNEIQYFTYDESIPLCKKKWNGQTIVFDNEKKQE